MFIPVSAKNVVHILKKLNGIFCCLLLSSRALCLSLVCQVLVYFLSTFGHYSADVLLSYLRKEPFDYPGGQRDDWKNISWATQTPDAAMYTR